MDQLIVGLLEFSRAGRHPFDVALIDMTTLAQAAAAEAMARYNGPRAADRDRRSAASAGTPR